MIDAYYLHYQLEPTKINLDLLHGKSNWIRWIPESKDECASLHCCDCRRYTVRCCTSDRSHGNCEFEDGLPDHNPQTKIEEFLI